MSFINRAELLHGFNGVSMTGKYAPPTEAALDYGHKALKLGISLIPYGGGPASEVLSWIVDAPIQQRLHDWRVMIGEAMQRSEQRQEGFIDEVRTNPAFIDTVLQASQAALRTSQQEKLDALRNAVLNSAMPHSPDESRRQIFINLIDTFTVWHLRILKLMDDPLTWYYEHGKDAELGIGGKVFTVVQYAFPELREERPFCHLIANNLAAQRLVTFISIDDDISQHVNMMHPTKKDSGPPPLRSGTGFMASRTTPLGRELLQFIASPSEPNK